MGKLQEQVHSRIGGSVEMRCEMLYLQTAKITMKSNKTKIVPLLLTDRAQRCKLWIETFE